MESDINPQASIAQRAQHHLSELGDRAFITNVEVEEAGILAINTVPSPALAFSRLLTEDTAFQIENGKCSCGEGNLPVPAPRDMSKSAFKERSCPHLLSLLRTQPFDGLCKCGHGEFHTVAIYANGTEQTAEYRCTHCNQVRGDRATPEQTFVHAENRIVAGPMSESAAAEYVTERSVLNISEEDELNPICSSCGTIQEVAVRSSNITGHLCPICDDPTEEIVE